MARISFEYFPGRSEKANNQLEETVSLLAEFQPEFQSVTYGAGGSNQQGSFDAVVAMQSTSGIPTASHLTYTGADKRDIEAFADQLWESDIKRIVALRGDDREGGKASAFANTPEFVAALQTYHPFEIAVACYPEVHPKATSSKEDLLYQEFCRFIILLKFAKWQMLVERIFQTISMKPLPMVQFAVRLIWKLRLNSLKHKCMIWRTLGMRRFIFIR